MGPDAEEIYLKRGGIAFEDAADVDDTVEIAKQFIKDVKEVSDNLLETIPEVDQSDHSTEMESLQFEQSITDKDNIERLKDGNDIKRSFRARLGEISSTCYNSICTSLGHHARQRRARICRVDTGVAVHVASLQQQLTSDVTQLRDFLRGRLFDQYCMMRGTPKEKKSETWLKYGECIILGHKNSKCENGLTKDTAETLNLGDPHMGARLGRMISESGLDPEWVMGHIVDYFYGNDHVGQWQRYVQGHRWTDLAEKFTTDIQQLEKMNSSRPSNRRRCNIMFNIHNSKRQYFKRLDGAQDYELSEKALRMEEEYECSSISSSSASSSTTSLVAVSEGYLTDL